MEKNCRLCKMVESILSYKGKIEDWSKDIQITTDNGETQSIHLTGKHYHFEDRREEAVRYLDDKVIFVTLLNQDYADDIIMGLPIEHLSNRELFFEHSDLTARLGKVSLDLIDREYGGHARILINQGTVFATQPSHTHWKLIKTGKTELYLPAISRR